MLHDDIGGHTNEKGRGQIEQLVDHRVGRSQKDAAVVGGVAPEAKKQVGSRLFSMASLPVRSLHQSALAIFAWRRLDIHFRQCLPDEIGGILCWHSLDDCYFISQHGDPFCQQI